MADYRDVQNDRHKRTERDYAATGGSSTFYWLIGIAALAVVTALFFLASGPSVDQQAINDPAGTTAPAQSDQEAAGLPEEGAVDSGAVGSVNPNPAAPPAAEPAQ